MKRIGEGKDAAAMAKFLLTDDSSWVTGQIIGVDGGRSKLTWSKLLKYHFYKNNIFSGEIDFVSSRINADTRSLLSRIKVENKDLKLISGSLLEVSVKFNLRNSLSVPDTSVMVEGDKSYVYLIDDKNTANKTEIKTGLRGNKSVEVISGLNSGDVIAAEGLKKVRPQGKIKPIYK